VGWVGGGWVWLGGRVVGGGIGKRGLLVVEKKPYGQGPLRGWTDLAGARQSSSGG